MARYHINPDNEPKVCSAKIKCEYETTENPSPPHFSNKKEATNFALKTIENEAKANGEYLVSKSRSTSRRRNKQVKPHSAKGIISTLSNGTDYQADYNKGMEDAILKMKENYTHRQNALAIEYGSYDPVEIGGATYQLGDFNNFYEKRGKSAYAIFYVNKKSFIVNRDKLGNWSNPEPCNINRKLDIMIDALKN